jgi:hypothetical protein
MTAGFAVFGSTLRRCDGFCVKREPDKPIGQLLDVLLDPELDALARVVGER